MRFIRILGSFALVFIPIFIIGCTQNPPTQVAKINATNVPDQGTPNNTVVVPLISNENGYPAPGQIIPTEPAYPAPAGESSITPLPKGQLPDAPTQAPQPQPGKASMSGTIFSFTSSMIIPDTLFYLTPGWGPEKKDNPIAFAGPIVKNGDIVLKTDDKGQFRINNVPPGNYYLAVWAPYNWVEAVVAPTDLKPLLIQLEADKQYPFGIVYVSWP